MPVFKGAGGVEWEMNVPEQGTYARELFDAKVAAGELVEVKDEAPKPPAAPHGNASTETWAAYAETLGVEVPDGATRDDIKALFAAKQ